MRLTASGSIGVCLFVCCINLLVAEATPIFPSSRSSSPRGEKRSDGVITPDLLEDELPEDEREEVTDWGGPNSRSKRAIDTRKLGEDFEEGWLDENGKLYLPGRSGLVSFILLTPKKKKIAFCQGYMAAVKYYGNVEVDYGNEHGSTYEQTEEDNEDEFGDTYEFGDFDSFNEDGSSYEFYYGDSSEEKMTTPPAGTTTTTPEETTTTTTEEPATTTTTTTSTTTATTTTESPASSTSDEDGGSTDSGGSSSSSSGSSESSNEYYESYGFDEDSFYGYPQYPNMYPHAGFPPHQQYYYPPHGYFPGDPYRDMGFKIPHSKGKRLVYRNNEWQLHDPEKGRVIGRDGRADVDTARQYYPISLKSYCAMLLEMEL